MYDDFVTKKSIEEQWDEYYDYCMQQEYEEYLKELDKEYEKEAYKEYEKNMEHEKEMKEDAFGTDYF